MSRLFWGLLFVALDYDVTVGSLTIGLIPDFLGFWLLMKGMETLADESKCFDRGRHWAFGMVLLSVVLYVKSFLNLSSGSKVGFWVLGLVGFCVGLFVLHQMVAGIRQMERRRGWVLQGEKLKTMWLFYAVMGLIGYLLNWVPLVKTFALLASAVTAVCLLVAMFGTVKRYEKEERDT